MVAAPASPRPNCNTDSEEDTMNGGLHTFNQTHMRKAFQLMNELRSKKMLCDVQLVAGSVEVPAHRVVLASCSPYFCAMFTGDMSESKAHQVEIREVDGQTLRKLVDYIYTAEIEVTEDNVQVRECSAAGSQPPAADGRASVCCEFLQSQLHPTNCLGIRAFADLHTCTQLLDQAHAYAEQHFSEVVQGEEFLGLSLQQVCSLISCDKLTVSTEEKVFEAMISWIKSDKPARLEYMPKLMEHVRLPLLSRDYLVQVMIVVGGQAPKAIRSVECYDFQDDRWYQVADLPSRRCRSGVCGVHGGRVFAVGGFNSSLRERTVDAYDAARDQWSAVASMQERRSTLGAAVLGDLLYAVGGFNGSIGLSTVEVLNYKTNEWMGGGAERSAVCSRGARRPPGEEERGGVCAINGLLYVIGGDDGSCNLSSVEYYNPAIDKWSLIPHKHEQRTQLR
ncbi:hypothetical protein F7725_010493, partial [Dissostichus mawsoni]